MELITKNHDGGLRLPLLSTDERDNLKLKDLVDPEAQAAKGLVIYNTTTNCLEFWNGETWISMCSDIQPDCSATVFPVLLSSYTLCTNATFADLTATVGGKELWYDAATDGAAHADGDPLVSGNTYYAEERVGACVSPTRAAVSVTLGDYCSPINSGAVTTFTNVMYDFQHQALEAYSTDGGLPTAFQWQFSRDNGVTYTDIPEAANSNYFTVLPHFADSYFASDYKADSLFFRCRISNAATPTPVVTSALNILFISTEDANGNPKGNYNIDPVTNIRYLTIQTNNKNFPSSTMKIALLNLGQSGTGAWLNGVHQSDNCELNDARDMGDFYQWGRIADGHEHTVWSKDANKVNQFLPFGNDANFTPNPVAKGTPSYTANGQIPDDNSDFYGKFITSRTDNDWGQMNSANNSRYGDGSKNNTTRASDIPLSAWSSMGKANNPCPSGWSVPSRWEAWDIYKGTGSDTNPVVSNGTTNPPPYGSGGNFVNGWLWRYDANNAFGGVIITNADDENVFLPAVGYRLSFDGLASGGGGVFCWSSTYYDTSSAIRSWSAYAPPGGVTAGVYSQYSFRANGVPVRCVAQSEP